MVSLSLMLVSVICLSFCFVSVHFWKCGFGVDVPDIPFCWGLYLVSYCLLYWAWNSLCRLALLPIFCMISLLFTEALVCRDNLIMVLGFSNTLVDFFLFSIPWDVLYLVLRIVYNLEFTHASCKSVARSNSSFSAFTFTASISDKSKLQLCSKTSSLTVLSYKIRCYSILRQSLCSSKPLLPYCCSSSITPLYQNFWTRPLDFDCSSLMRLHLGDVSTLLIFLISSRDRFYVISLCFILLTWSSC